MNGKIILVLFFLAAIITQSSSAQNWQWGVRGGSNGNSSTNDNEFVTGLTIDRNGNLYVLANTGITGGIDISGQSKTGFGGKDIILASYKCDGTLRWVKIIGGAQDDAGFAIRADKLDGVYISVAMFRGPQKIPLYIDNDKIINSNDEKSQFFIKYDTSGNLKWVKAPQPDTVTFTQQAVTIDMDIDSAGNIFALCQLPPGLYENTFVAIASFTSQGYPNQDCVLKYDKDGNFSGGMAFDTKGCFGAHMIRDAQTKKYYISGNSGNPIPMGNTSIAKFSGYIACFSEEGGYLWDIQSNTAGIYSRPLLDPPGNIYLAGYLLGPISNASANFNGFVATNATVQGSPFIIKLDSNRNNLWGTYAIVNNSATNTCGIAKRNSGEIVYAGYLPGLLAWVTYTKDSINYPPNSGQHPYITRFNTQTGKVLGVDKLETDKQDAYTYDIISDGRNNVYIGGEMAGRITVNGKDLYNVGGRNDWFAAKYGHGKCNCTNIPEPKFTYTKNAINDLTFTYTGTPYSSIEWDFDDGTSSTNASPNHIYTQGGTFTVCVKVVNSCGDNTYCTILDTWPVSVSNLSNTGNIRIYPNPANDELYIEGLSQDSKIELYDIVGRIVHISFSNNQKEKINISTLPIGSYVITLTDNQGYRTTSKFVKQ